MIDEFSMKKYDGNENKEVEKERKLRIYEVLREMALERDVLETLEECEMD